MKQNNDKSDVELILSLVGCLCYDYAAEDYFIISSIENNLKEHTQFSCYYVNRFFIKNNCARTSYMSMQTLLELVEDKRVSSWYLYA